ncbi:NADPH-dependent FMN reductase [Chitinispirillum alkaliphilum]|nr:NADPH-dependent FMN reductase [Chitinispirillum alkaliphilum]
MRKVLLITGTVREGRKSPRATKLIHKHLLKNESVEVATADLADLDIPMLKERLKFLKDPHPDIVKLGKLIVESDTLIIVSPEYNGSMPGVLKNALDHYIDEYEDKTVGIVTVSKGPRGGDSCYLNLKELFRRLDARRTVHLKINKVNETLSEDGDDLDEYGERVDEFLGDVLG